jgi:uncharacterized radical SAM protein YgiQ
VPILTSSSTVEIPSFEDVSSDRFKYAEAYRRQSLEMNPFCGGTIVQRHGNRRLVCNPPAFPLAEDELDAVYALPFTKAPHPVYKDKIPAYEQIRSSITTHRGCFGGCAFCAITHHQGKIVQSRSEKSILREAGELSRFAWFKGSVSDVGGPTANMYGLSCSNSTRSALCRRTSCLYPVICRHLNYSGRRAADLLCHMRDVPGIKHVAVSSGVRYDLLDYQPEYGQELLANHVGGLLKVAPEHLVDRVTDVMRKPRRSSFEKFLEFFREESCRLGKKQYVVPYLISGHPGCTLSDMVELALILRQMGLRVEQVQDFTPTPGTLSACMYFTGMDPFTGEKVYVPRSDKEKQLQKALLLSHLPEERKNVLQALKACGRESSAIYLFGEAYTAAVRHRDNRKK